MAVGVNHYIILSALVFGFGVYTVISARNRSKSIIGISLLFSASLLNIAAFSGFKWFNPEGQIVFILVSVICLLIVLTGIFLSYKGSEINNKAESNI